jgi:hypothetical protein
MVRPLSLVLSATALLIRLPGLLASPRVLALIWLDTIDNRLVADLDDFRLNLENRQIIHGNSV